MDNTYKVSKRQWKKWDENEKYIFNSLYEMMLNNQSLFKYPNADLIPTAFWTTTAWNAAWMAADFAKEARKNA